MIDVALSFDNLTSKTRGGQSWACSARLCRLSDRVRCYDNVRDETGSHYDSPGERLGVPSIDSDLVHALLKVKQEINHVR